MGGKVRNDLKRVARACLAFTPLVWACSIYEYEGMALVSPTDILVVGDTVGLSVVAHDGSMPSPSAVAWRSSDTTVATVDELGVVTGTGRGGVVIEARTGDYALKMSLVVVSTAGPFGSAEGGAHHNCGLDQDGRAWCWGSNQDGQLGTALGPDKCFITPVEELGPFFWCAKGAIPVDTDVRFTELVVGSSDTPGSAHTCGLSTEGTAYCWGSNDRGELGDGGDAPSEWRARPEPVAGAHVFASLTAGGETTCGVTVDEALLCWGAGYSRANGTSEDVATPSHVAGQHRFAFATTNGSHTCGVTTDGATWCWGFNDSGQLGVAGGDAVCFGRPCTAEPQEVASAPAFVGLALGDAFSCGLTAGGAAHCWGGNELGQLGDGTRTGRLEPTPVAGGHAFTRLGAGRAHACGLDGTGSLHCWGHDGAGFGNGGDAVEVDQPAPAAAGLTFTAITIGPDTQCGVDPSGVTWCWGSNFVGALGNGRTQRVGVVSTPVRVVRHPATQAAFVAVALAGSS